MADDQYQAFKAKILGRWLRWFYTLDAGQWLCKKGCEPIADLDEAVQHLKRHYPRFFADTGRHLSPSTIKDSVTSRRAAWLKRKS